jgi:hypothetical protein
MQEIPEWFLGTMIYNSGNGIYGSTGKKLAGRAVADLVNCF